MKSTYFNYDIYNKDEPIYKKEEEYLEKDKQGQEAEDINGDRAINYIKKLLENCCDDIRDYISKHKIKDEEYSKD